MIGTQVFQICFNTEQRFTVVCAPEDVDLATLQKSRVLSRQRVCLEARSGPCSLCLHSSSISCDRAVYRVLMPLAAICSVFLCLCKTSMVPGCVADLQRKWWLTWWLPDFVWKAIRTLQSGILGCRCSHHWCLLGCCSDQSRC